MATLRVGVLCFALLVSALSVGCSRDSIDDPCEGIDCSGHGECIHDEAGVRCVCDEGYEADYLSCAVSDPHTLDPCEGIDCSGHGECVNDEKVVWCVCEEDYEAIGLSCVASAPHSSDPCDGIDCSGHGECVHDESAVWCVCEEDYEADGLNCVLSDPYNCEAIGTDCTDIVESPMCRSLTFESTVTYTDGDVHFVDIGETVTFEIDLQLDQAELVDIPPWDSDGCDDDFYEYDDDDYSDHVVSFVGCHEQEWSFPTATYTLTYSGGYSQTGSIDRIRILNGGAIEREVCDLFDCRTYWDRERDEIVFYDGHNSIWEAWDNLGRWKERCLSCDLATELESTLSGDAFRLTRYMGNWGCDATSPSWLTYHYDYLYDRYTSVTWVPCEG